MVGGRRSNTVSVVGSPEAAPALRGWLRDRGSQRFRRDDGSFDAGVRRNLLPILEVFQHRLGMRAHGRNGVLTQLQAQRRLFRFQRQVDRRGGFQWIADLLDTLLPQFHGNGAGVSVFPLPSGKGVVPELDKFEAHLREELSRVE